MPVEYKLTRVMVQRCPLRINLPETVTSWIETGISASLDHCSFVYYRASGFRLIFSASLMVSQRHSTLYRDSATKMLIFRRAETSATVITRQGRVVSLHLLTSHFYRHKETTYNAAT